MGGRYRILTFFFFAVFLLIFGRLFYWQVFKSKQLSSVAAKQYSNKKEIPTERGKIFSSDSYPLVLNGKSYLLYANPAQLKLTPSELAEKLSPFLNEGKSTRNKIDLLLDKDKNSPWVSLANDLDLREKEIIEKLKISGLGFEDREKRYYPEASLSAQLLGFDGEDEQGNKKGYFGLEGYYDNELRGRPGTLFFEQDALGRPIPLSDESEEKPIAGRDLILYLDRPLQFLVENRLKKGVEKYKASSGLITVMNPKNGAILAMASWPSYDPEKYYLYESDFYRNPVISSSFEPGSIFKIIVMASALDAGVIGPQERCSNCDGPRTIYGYTIKTWNEKYFPNSTVTDILVHSDNVGMVYVSEKLGKDLFYDYVKKFGFGNKTGIDLQGEDSPILRDKKNWSRIDLATASFGQGIAITPIQLLTAVSAIANKGELLTPKVVKSIVEDGQKKFEAPTRKERIISEQAANQVKEMMIEAVEKGEAKWLKLNGYRIAGKTGTAQIPIEGHYDPDKTIASFIGFAPAEDPKFVMLVCLKEPKTSPWGSETAAPLWFEVAKDIFRLWNINPNL